MSEQMSLYDFEVENLRPPEMWGCMKYCENSNKFTDRFPGTKLKRCMYGRKMDGTSGDDMYEEKDQNGFIHFYCKYYRPK